MKTRGLGLIENDKVGFKDVEIPEMGPDDALVKPIAVATCTSDVHAYFGDEDGTDTDRFSVILGHEAVGEIIDTGKNVKDFKKGDKVVVPCTTPDWNCEASQCGASIHATSENGYDLYAEDMLSGIKYPNAKNGVFSEIFHVNHADMNLAHLTEDISIESALMATDMMTTGFGGAEKANIQTGDSVAVLGIGPVGLMAVAAASIMGAGRIFAVGSRPKSVELAKEYGATDIIDYHNGDTVQQIMEATTGKGVDSVIVAGGNADIMMDALNMVRPSGTVSNINFFASGDTVPLPRFGWGLGLSDKTITGGLCKGGRRRMEKLLELVRYGRVDPSKLITHKYHGFEEIIPALYIMKEKPRDLIKPIIYTDDI